jgi:hypothetical protein
MILSEDNLREAQSQLLADQPLSLREQRKLLVHAFELEKMLEARINVPGELPAEKLRPREQKCARCGAVDGMNFHVPDETWRSVAGPEWTGDRHDTVLCLACFDQLAAEKVVEYADVIGDILFTGRTDFHFWMKRPVHEG